MWTVIALFACTPSYEDAPDVAGAAYCDRSVECGWVEESDYDSCADDAEDLFQLLWPEDECEDDLSRDGWDRCMEAIADLNCDDWTRGATSLGSCDADTVCD